MKTAEGTFKKHFDVFRSGLHRASLDHYLDTGTLSGSMLLSARECLEEYSSEKDKEIERLKKEAADKHQHIREAVARYMKSEGCSCCQDIAAHRINNERLAELLGVDKYDDGSGYDFASILKNIKP